MHHFDGVTGVVFVADLSSYCAAPLEEEAAGKTLLHEEIEVLFNPLHRDHFSIP